MKYVFKLIVINHINPRSCIIYKYCDSKDLCIYCSCYYQNKVWNAAIIHSNSYF